MTDDRFDNLTKLVSRNTSRRGLLKGAAAAALGGVAMRFRGNHDAEARARIKMACARLGQPCNTIAGTPGNRICCPHLVCDTDLTCCKPTNESCVDDGDCCAGNVCRPNPSGLGNRCLPPGEFGAECVKDADCASSLCDAYSATCTSDACGGVCDFYLGEVTCGLDSRTNDVCSCYPVPGAICGCVAANSCGNVLGCCDTNVDCGAGEICFIPPVPTDFCGCGGSAGFCGLACDFQGDPYTTKPLSLDSARW